MFLEWGPEFETGVPEMDRQHRRLLEKANEFHTALKEGNRSRAKDILVDFTKALFNHLRDEEKFMERIGYPELDNHRKLHRSLAGMIKEVRDEFEKGDPRAFSQSLSLIMSWLLTHIKKSDRKYGEYLQRKS